MQLALLIAAGLQSSVSVEPTTPPINLNIPQSCNLRPRAASDEIVICGNNHDSPYRLKGAEGSSETLLPEAKIEIANGVGLVAETEKGHVGGIPTNRAMVRVKIKF